MARSRTARRAISWQARLPTAEDARLLARRRQPRLVFDFIDGAAGTDDGLARNEAALRALRLMPRVLVDIQGGSTDLATQQGVVKRPLGDQRTAPDVDQHPVGTECAQLVDRRCTKCIGSNEEGR